MAIRVQNAPFDPGAEVNALHAANVGIGAVVGFVGYVRDFNAGQDVAGMFLEHYPGMTEKALAKIAVEAEQRCCAWKSSIASAPWSPASRLFLSAPPAPTARPLSRPATSLWIT